MSTTELLSAIKKLTAAEQIELIDQVWDSLSARPEALPIPDWHKEELARRKAAYQNDPESAIPWEEAREWLRQRHG